MGAPVRGIVVAGAVVPGTELVQRDAGAWWSWDEPRDRADLRRRPRDATLLVGHWTGGAIREGVVAARATVEAMKARTREDGSLADVSCHFVIGWDGAVHQVADLSVGTVHAGTRANKVSIGVETAWPGYESQAHAIARTLERKGRPVHMDYYGAVDVRTLPSGRTVRCLRPSSALVSAWVALAELLAALPPELGVVIPRQLAAPRGKWDDGRGACEHLHCPPFKKYDAAGYLVDALERAGWAPG